MFRLIIIVLQGSSRMKIDYLLQHQIGAFWNKTFLQAFSPQQFLECQKCSTTMNEALEVWRELNNGKSFLQKRDETWMRLWRQTFIVQSDIIVNVKFCEISITTDRLKASAGLIIFQVPLIIIALPQQSNLICLYSLTSPRPTRQSTHSEFIEKLF